MDSPAISLDKVSCLYGGLAAVDEVSLEIGRGERVALIGPSGSGKTTLLRAMNTIRRPERGLVTVFGEDVSGCSPRELRRLRSRIAFIPQHLGLVPNLRVIQNVLSGSGGARGLLRSLRDLLYPAKADVMEAHAILERVGVGEKLYMRTDRLSGGQQQRVAIARSLFQGPEVLLADEPVASVDPARARDTVRLLTELSTEKNLTLCMSLHNIELAREFFPRLVGMRSGRVVIDSQSEALDDSKLEELYKLSDQEMIADA